LLSLCFVAPIVGIDVLRAARSYAVQLKNRFFLRVDVVRVLGGTIEMSPTASGFAVLSTTSSRVQGTVPVHDGDIFNGRMRLRFDFEASRNIRRNVNCSSFARLPPSNGDCAPQITLQPVQSELGRFEGLSGLSKG
jgi:hypothetical protein